MDCPHLNPHILPFIMKSLPYILVYCLALGLPTFTTSSLLRPRVPQSPGSPGNITSYNSTSSSNFNSTNSNSSLLSPQGTNCQSAVPLSTNINYPFILTANSNWTNTSISLIPSPLLGSTFHISNGTPTDPQNQGVFVLSPDGTLEGGLNDQVHNAGNCTLLSYGYDEFAVQFPSCAVGNATADKNGTGVSVVGNKWIARNACVEGEDLLILLPDFGGNSTVVDHCKSSCPRPWTFSMEGWLISSRFPFCARIRSVVVSCTAEYLWWVIFPWCWSWVTWHLALLSL